MRSEDGLIPAFSLDPTRTSPLHAQLYREIREAIVSRRLLPGSRLPSTRTLAGDLGVSRTTTLEAYRHLESEGYVESDPGSGTYVAHQIPDDVTRVVASAPSPTRQPEARTGDLSNRGRALSRLAHDAFVDVAPGPFLPGVPALDAFPWRAWRRAEHHVLVTRKPELGAGDPAGHSVLREAIAAHLRATRAMECASDQLVVTSDAQEAFSILADLLLDPADPVLMEDPGYTAVYRVFEASSADIVPVPVDGDGMDVFRGFDAGSGARLAYVTPAHQFPMGVTLSLARRRQLIEWARSTGSWIVEDDYDCEYRFEGTPLPAIRSLKGGESCTIYVGTFAKILCPAVSLGFVVLPRELVGPFTDVRALRSSPIHLMPQLTLAAFIRDGRLARHIRRMRTLYSERGKALQRSIRAALGEHLDPEPPSAGMHLIAWLRHEEDGMDITRRAVLNGVYAPTLSFFRSRSVGPEGLVLGFGAVPVQETDRWVGRLAGAFQ